MCSKVEISRSADSAESERNKTKQKIGNVRDENRLHELIVPRVFYYERHSL